MTEKWKAALIWALVVLLTLAQFLDLGREIKYVMRFAATALLCYNIYSIRLQKR